jgi:hypothetical protein|tara:strand:- start:14910 stop:15629 length:720 start_codon:yes stop_codon:yes gene_type:complete
MISIDTIYQKVLAFANKEQRGYITPQEFNLFAHQAQMEIFEQYFYDNNAARRVQGNDTIYSDIDDMLEEKLQVFEFSDGQNAISQYQNVGNSLNVRLPDYVYRVHRVEALDKECELLNTKDFNNCREGGPLTRPSNDRPIANIRAGIIRCVGGNNNFTTLTGLIYFKKPEKPNWAYVVINEKAMYDATNAVDFELHASEETELVYKILKYAGISMQRQDAAQAGQSMETMMKQQQSKIQ